MKRISIILSFFALAFAFSSCEKDPPRPDYHFSFKIDGVEKKFSATTDANIFFKDNIGSGVRLAFWTMVSDINPEKNAVVVSLRTYDLLELGRTYQMQDEILFGTEVIPSMTMLYFDENGKAFGAVLLASANPGARDNCSISLSDFTTEGTTGTFTGVLFDMEDTTTPLADRRAYLLTEGKFFLPNLVENR